MARCCLDGVDRLAYGRSVRKEKESQAIHGTYSLLLLYGHVLAHFCDSNHHSLVLVLAHPECDLCSDSYLLVLRVVHLELPQEERVRTHLYPGYCQWSRLARYFL